MLKKEFVSKVAALSSLTEGQVDLVLDAARDVVLAELSESRDVRVPGLVQFKALARNERAARNPKTGEPYMVKAGFTIKARPVGTLASVIESTLVLKV